MNANQWLKATDPQVMLEFLGKRASDRKLRLFACACCRRVWHLAKSQQLKQALPLLEDFAGGTMKDRDRARAHSLCDEVLQSLSAKAVQKCLAGELWQVSKKTVKRRDPNYTVGAFAAHSVSHAAGEYGEEWDAVQKAEREQQVSLVHELFGNPFQPVKFSKKWRTTDVALLANGISEECAFDRMPILADALQDAGCDSDDLLNHLRDASATHVRGCWALDLVLG
jgi:hypothetical protein